jgi:hypothetical protein
MREVISLNGTHRLAEPYPASPSCRLPLIQRVIPTINPHP